MSNLYLRKYRLIIGEAVTTISTYSEPVRITTTKINPQYLLESSILAPVNVGVGPPTPPLISETTETPSKLVSQRTEGGNAVEITELKIEASISRSLSVTGQGGDTTQIKIYNLSPASKKYLQGPNAVVQLYAGYESDAELALLYSGYIIKQSTTKQGQDKITTLNCVDASVPKAAAKAEVSLPPGTQTKDAIRALASGIPGLSIGYINADSVSQPVLTRGFSYSGGAWEGLNLLCRNNGLWCLVENGTINVAPVKLNDRSPEVSSYKAKAVVITPQLIKGSIEPMDDNSLSSPTEGSKTAIRVNTFLDARLTVDGFMRIQGTEEYDGDYRITSVTHSLDSRGGAWDTTVESERIA